MARIEFKVGDVVQGLIVPDNGSFTGRITRIHDGTFIYRYYLRHLDGKRYGYVAYDEINDFVMVEVV